MLQMFNYFGLYEIPLIRLCNPDKKQIGILNGCYNINVELVFNNMSQISITVPSQINGTKYPHYNDIKSKKLILVEGKGYFIINNVKEESNGLITEKVITAYSLEAELNYKKVNLLNGTYKLYDILNPQKTLLGKIIEIVPAWSIGHVDVDLMNSYMTFDIPDSTVYQFLMNDVENKYECVFLFDTFNKTINAYTLNNSTKKTDIYLSFDNLLKNLDMVEMADQLCTAMKVYGGGGLDISGVNPIGVPTIYDFSYFKTTDWMSQELIDALDSWETKLSNNKEPYKTLLLSLKTNNGKIIGENIKLKELESDYLALEGVQKVRIQQGQSYSDITSQMRAKQAEIDNKKSLIATLENEVKTINQSLNNINTSLKFENNFSPTLFKELQSYIIENTYQNDSYIQTSQMDLVEKQDMAQGLYDQGERVLSRVSQPRFKFDINSVNFLFLKEFKPFIDQLELGCIVNVDIRDNYRLKPILLRITFSYDNPEEFELTFGNRYRLDDADFVFSELFGDALKGGSSVKFDSGKWGEWVNSGAQDSVTDFINSSLDATKNNLISSNRNEIVINQNGLKGQYYIPETGTYSPEKVWLTTNTLAFTRNNWDSAVLALGKLDYNGQSLYGLNSEILIGKIIAGNQLQISNSNNNFVLDNSGATLQNANFNVITTDQKTKITISPSNGISIESRPNTAVDFTKKFYIDTNGNAVFAGKVTAAEGTIAGWNIQPTRLSDSYGNYIGSDGNIKLGMLTITPSSATFNGNIYARNLVGGIGTENIQDEAVTPAKLDRLYATRAQFNSLQADVADFETLYATKSYVRDQFGVNGTFSGRLSAATGSFKGELTAGTTYANAISCTTLYTKGIIWGGQYTIKMIYFTDKDGDTHGCLGRY